MQFIADESCDFAVVRALRAAGHDVVAVAELDAGLEDDSVVARALDEHRVLLTEDKDFGQIVFASGRPAAGVVFIRFPAGARSGLAAAVCACEKGRRRERSEAGTAGRQEKSGEAEKEGREARGVSDQAEVGG